MRTPYTKLANFLAKNPKNESLCFDNPTAYPNHLENKFTQSGIFTFFHQKLWYLNVSLSFLLRKFIEISI